MIHAPLQSEGTRHLKTSLLRKTLQDYRSALANLKGSDGPVCKALRRKLEGAASALETELRSRGLDPSAG